MLPHVRQSKVVLDSGSNALDSKFHVLDSRSVSLSVVLGFRIQMISGIPDSLSSIRDSKTQDSGFFG